jgi:hypothetical protein
MLGKAMLIYSCGDGQNPIADKWCDLLVEHAELTEKEFVCPSDKKARCSYAINPNTAPNSPPDNVVLFETEGGWNQFGGPQLLTFENHEEKGCNILFNDLHVKFIKPEDVNELNWGIESTMDK